ncbi:MAG: hypothetical protein IH830_10025 [Planctomycetes bacterium]|nr:hypothetical protein [Planctomycetota bacterium]
MTPRARNGDSGSPKGRPRGHPEQHEQHEQQQQPDEPAAAPAAAGRAHDESDPTVLHELDLVGIGEPVRSKLAAEPGISVGVVRQAQVPGRGPGITVENIRAALRQRRAQVEEQTISRRRETSSAPGVAARLRAEDAAIERPDAEWVRAEAARHGLDCTQPAASREDQGAAAGDLPGHALEVSE